MITLEELQRIAEVEYAKVVTSTAIIGVKLRIVLADTSYMDVWLSKKMPDRFGFHWERRAIDGTIFQYDNFPNTNWKALSSYPYHFHDGNQSNVIVPLFASNVLEGFRDFMGFVQKRIVPTP